MSTKKQDIVGLAKVFVSFFCFGGGRKLRPPRWLWITFREIIFSTGENVIWSKFSEGGRTRNCACE